MGVTKAGKGAGATVQCPATPLAASNSGCQEVFGSVVPSWLELGLLLLLLLLLLALPEQPEPSPGDQLSSFNPPPSPLASRTLSHLSFYLNWFHNDLFLYSAQH